jgi:hypothetical protein
MKRLILALLTGAALAASSPAYAAVKTVVLVHGAFADGSGWKPVADILQSHGYSVRVSKSPRPALRQTWLRRAAFSTSRVLVCWSAIVMAG